LLFACSGGSDVGELAARACRGLAERGHGDMYCLAGIGGGISGVVKTTEEADELAAIDGCPVGCRHLTARRLRSIRALCGHGVRVPEGEHIDHHRGA